MTSPTRTTDVRRVVVIAEGGTRRDFHLTMTGRATVQDVIDAVAALEPSGWADTLFVDGQGFPCSMALADVAIEDGALLAPMPTRRPHQESIVELLAVAGEDAGSTLRFGPGRFALGFRRRVATLDIDESGTSRLTPDPHRGIRISGRMHHHPVALSLGDVIEVEATAYALAPSPGPMAPRPGTQFNRQPRTLPPADPERLTAPSRDAVTMRSTAFRWPMLLAPVLMGVIMMLVFQRLAFLFLIALGPIMLLANFIDARLRNRKGSRRAETAFKKELAAFRPLLEDWRAATHAAARIRHPSLPQVVQRAIFGDDRLWERRRHHDDFMRLFVGYGAAPFASPIASERLEAEVATMVAEPDRRGSFPIEIDLAPGAVVGLTGPPTVSRALARSLLVQAVVHHGPADLAVGIISQASSADEWKFAGWLPHNESHQGRQLLAASPEDAATVFSEVRASERPTLLVLDGEYSPERAGLIAEITADHLVSVLVIADSLRSLPGVTAVNIEVRPGANLILTETATGRRNDSVTAVLMKREVVDEAARALARLSDPERATIGGSLPGQVSLLDLLGIQDPTPAAISEAWAHSGSTIKAPIGKTAGGILEIDLVKDGPHALLAGTTGAGKSELLRTLVASLAACVDPEHLNFVLIDYKGGSAFDVCADLPHVVGLVTDLDPQLATRAVTCLEAELEYREHRLRDAGASDLPAYLDLGLREPLPRLFIVIDEFAAMAKDMPEFMEALVDIAARGRSLGVHLMLATQRPAGVIKESIRANTNLRMALRVQSVSDSKDVLGDDAAAGLPRAVPGRGYVRFGPSELVGFQTALVTGATGFVERSVVLQEARFDPQGPTAARATVPDGVKTDLERLVAAIREAAVAADMKPGHTPWPPALTPDLPLHTLLPGEHITLGLADEPQRQRHVPLSWDPSNGPLGLYGIPGTGPQAAVETAIRSIAATHTHAQAHVFLMKFGTHPFDAVAGLPHLAPLVEPENQELQMQLLRMLKREFDERRRDPSQVTVRPLLFLVIDDAGSFRDIYESYHLMEYMDIAAEIIAKGAPLGVHVIATMSRPNALPMKVAGAFVDRFVFQFADMSHAMSLGVKRSALVEDLPYGGLIDARTGLLGQIAVVHDGVPVREAADAVSPSVPVLPPVATYADLPPAAITPDRSVLPIGIGESRVEPFALHVEEGDHILVTSPVRGGRSSLLALLARHYSEHSSAQLVAVVPRKSPLQRMDCFKYVVEEPAEIEALSAALLDSGDEPIVVFVDDAEMVQSKGLEQLLAGRKSNVLVIAAMRNEEATRSYNHWSKRVKDSRKGVAIRPSPGIAEMYGHKLPKSTTPLPPGRGYVIDGHTLEKVQVALCLGLRPSAPQASSPEPRA